MEKNKKSKAPFVVVTDSSSDIPLSYVEKYNIKVIPMYINYNGMEYKDGVDINSNRIYSLQKEEKAVFGSSSPSPKDFSDVYRELLDHYEKIISIHISSRLSAVINSAGIARSILGAEEKIEIIDSLSGTMGCGFMVIGAAKAIMKGYGWNRISEIIFFLRENIKLYGTIDTLKYLRTSGRVPVLANIATSALKIKPILGLKDGVVGMIGITVTRPASISEVLRRILRDFRDEKWVIASIIHSLSYEEAGRMMKKIQSSLNCVEAIITECTPVVGAHTGPGLIGVIISKLDKRAVEIFI